MLQILTDSNNERLKRHCNALTLLTRRVIYSAIYVDWPCVYLVIYEEMLIYDEHIDTSFTPCMNVEILQSHRQANIIQSDVLFYTMILHPPRYRVFNESQTDVCVYALLRLIIFIAYNDIFMIDRFVSKLTKIIYWVLLLNSMDKSYDILCDLFYYNRVNFSLGELNGLQKKNVEYQNYTRIWIRRYRKKKLILDTWIIKYENKIQLILTAGDFNV